VGSSGSNPAPGTTSVSALWLSLRCEKDPTDVGAWVRAMRDATSGDQFQTHEPEQSKSSDEA